MYRFKRLFTRLLPHHVFVVEAVISIFSILIFFTGQAFAVIRFTDRSVFVLNPNPSVVTTYKVSFTYTTQTAVGSVDMLFCFDPIPTDPCVTPTGLDVSHAVLSSQTGETGYHILTQTKNHIILSRAPQTVANTPSTYTFTGVVNPSDEHAFSIRLSDYSSTDASGPLIDLGSVIAQASDGVVIQTQVPPMLIFCVAQEVAQNCVSMSDNHYTDMGQLSSNSTLTASSQMAAGTNASGGYVITANGTTMEAGTSIIDPLSSPTVSAPGNTQFGINLRANTVPNVGSDPDGDFANATPTANYDIPNKFTYQDGAVVASAPEVSLVRRFTVSYIVNVSPSLRPGVYTTTITYVCSGRF